MYRYLTEKTHTNQNRHIFHHLCAFSILCEEGLRFRLLRRVDFGQIVLVDPPSKDAEGERVECSAFLCIISFFSLSAVMDEQSKF